MPKNAGKKFEEDFEKSVSHFQFVQRLKDDTMRFADVFNIADFILYECPKLYLLELKSHKGASFPLTIERYKKGKRQGQIKKFGVIGKKQLDALNEYRDRKGTTAGYVFNFSDKELTYYIPVGDVYDYIYDEHRTRQSISLDWCIGHGALMQQEKKRTRYRYDLTIT